jgi:hypothetical protein
MRCFWLSSLFVPVLLCLTPVFAQSTTTTQVCVASLENSRGGVSATGTRDALIKVLNKQKNLHLEGVPLNITGPSEALAEAKEKKCEYVVTTNLVGLGSDTEVSRSPGVAGVGGGSMQVQVFHVTVDYKLAKVSDGAEESKGSLEASDRSAAQNATVIAMKQVAEKVADSIRKAGASAK